MSKEAVWPLKRNKLKNNHFKWELLYALMTTVWGMPFNFGLTLGHSVQWSNVTPNHGQYYVVNVEVTLQSVKCGMNALYSSYAQGELLWSLTIRGPSFCVCRPAFGRNLFKRHLLLISGWISSELHRTEPWMTHFKSCSKIMIPCRTLVMFEADITLPSLEYMCILQR